MDFTPSVGARLPAIEALAEAHEVPLAGSDGKTGETFMKSVLAPAFGARNLKVRSWAGMNILGGGDGAALADPARAQSKLHSKGKLLDEILGYPVEAPIHIEDVRDMGEWKTAWDHIVFEGFLGVRMKLQFTWEGCDSALAAPLLLDLMRLMALALDRRERGVLPGPRLLLQGPGRHARARAAPPVRDARALGGPEGRGLSMPAAADLAELVRLPAVLSVPGDVLVGAAASGQVGRVGRTAGLVASSSCLYLAGMALNDYADREVDAVERPGSADSVRARVAGVRARSRGCADRAAPALLAVAADGPRALAVALPLAAAVWSYDLVLKSGPAGVAAMSACRGLDVMMGSGARGAAARAARRRGGHRAHRRRHDGVAPGDLRRRRDRRRAARWPPPPWSPARPRWSASGKRRRAGPDRRLRGDGRPRPRRRDRRPSPARLQKAVGAGIMGLIPLEAGLLAGAGSVVPAAGVAALWPLARRAAKRRARRQ